MEEESSGGFYAGGAASPKQGRTEIYRNALLAGERKAEKFYVYAALEDFMEEKPMVPYQMKLTGGGKVPVVFVNYYITIKDKYFMSDEQRKFVQIVYDFKDGHISCAHFFKDAIAKLGLPEQVAVVFMPCGNQEKYLKRFRLLNETLEEDEGLIPVMYSHQYIAARQSKHRSKNRNEIDAGSNVIVRPDIAGRKVVLIDDVITTGGTVREYVEVLRPYGVEVVGVVCLGKTVRYPSKKAIWLASHFERAYKAGLKNFV